MSTRHPYGSGKARLDGLLGAMEPEELREIVVLSKEENDTFEECSLKRFPYSAWEGIDWERLDPICQEFTSGESEAASLLNVWLSRRTSPESLLVVFWGNAVVPAVALPSKCAVNHSEEILYTSSDVWVFAADEGILIEYTHNGRLTLGYIPSN